MGKKHNKGVPRIGGSAAATGTVLGKPEPERTEDGFHRLGPKPDGENAFTEFMRKRSKKSGLITKPEPPMAYADYDPTKIMNRLETAMEFISRGKFGKSYDGLDKTLIDELVDAFLHMDTDLANMALVSEAVTKLLITCKSFYEYDEKHREILSNPVYDQVLARYTGLGMIEPTGIVPSNGKKTGITYPELHNNMDKAYILKKGELIPEGVKESDSVEDFLMRAYEAAGWQTNEELTVELSPKIDGVSVNGTMKHGCLVKPQTRGDQDASMSIIGLNGIELGSDSDDEFGIQYECFVLDEDREKAAAYLKLKKPYVSNRHAAAGIISRLCTEENDGLLEFLSFYPIEAAGLQEDMSYQNRIKFIQKYGCVPDDMIERKTITGDLTSLLKEIHETFGKYAKKREKLSYSIDGMVLTIVDEEVREALGRKGRTNQYQIGYKFDPANAEAVVKGIYLDSGRKGYRTIQVELEHPVFLDGVRYDHVPVLSAGLFDELNLRIGSVVNVHRVGDVIPSISVIKEGDGKKLKAIGTCPHCGGTLVVRNKKMYCENPKCDGNIVGKYAAFLDAIGVDGYGDAFLAEFAEKINPDFAGYISNITGVTVEMMKDAGMTDKLSLEFPDKVAKAMTKAPDYVVIGAMGWPDIGTARAKELLKGYGGLAAFIKGFVPDTMIDKWTSYIGEIGTKTAKMLIRDCKWFNAVRQDLELVSHSISVITKSFIKQPKIGHTGGDLSDEVIAACKARGYEVTDGKSFDVLITTSMSSTSGKMETAKKRNKPIYTAEEFLAHLDEVDAIISGANALFNRQRIATDKPMQVCLGAVSISRQISDYTEGLKTLYC